MKVVVPYTDLRPETLDGLRFARKRDVMFVDVSASPYAYGELLERLWDAGETFCLIEHDIEIGPSTLYDFRACNYGYCGAPYAWTTNVGVALGCVRFRDSFIAQHPLAVRKALDKKPTFAQLDVCLQRAILVREYGQQPHVHACVIHHNAAKALLPDASPEPLAVLPSW